MKQAKNILIAILILISSIGFSQDIPDDAIMIDENTIIKNELGEKVELTRFMELMDSGEWMIDPVKDDDGKTSYLQLRKATEEEKEMMQEMMGFSGEQEMIGKKAPEFEMKNMDGQIISSKTTKGKVLVLNFWFAACKPCIDEIPELNKVYEQFKNNPDVVFASITFESAKQVNAFLEKYPMEYPIVNSADEICKLFNVSSYPTNIIIDRNGNYYENITGGFPKIGEYISKAIEGALQDK